MIAAVAALLVPLLACIPLPARAEPAEAALAKSRTAVDQTLAELRRQGQLDAQGLAAAESSARAGLALDPSDATRAGLLSVLADVARIGAHCDDALPQYAEAARSALKAGRRDLVFRAELGTARCSLDLKDHDATAAALDRAETAAGDAPDPSQVALLALWRTQALTDRGELEAALPWAARAIRSAVSPLERFLGINAAAGVFSNFADGCDFTLDVSRCLHAAGAAERLSQRAAAAAREESANFMAMMTESRAGATRNILNIRLGARTPVPPDLVAPKTERDVRVQSAHGGLGMQVTEAELEEQKQLVAGLFGPPAVTTAIAQQIALRHDRQSSAIRVEASTAEAKGDLKAAMALYLKAVDLVERERGSFFDLSKRGTTVATEKSTYQAPALLLLNGGRDAEAFRLFELARARGLAELYNLGGDANLSAAELGAIATLLDTEARQQDATRRYADKAIALEDVPLDDPALEELASNEAHLRRLAAEWRPLLARLAARPPPPFATLDGLQEAAIRDNLPVLLYWSTGADLIGWYVGAEGSVPLSIFLPLETLRQKVAAVRRSSATRGMSFDQTTARELYLLLIQPFARYLTPPGVVIVPYGALNDLPFEALVNPVSGRYLAEEHAVSYAPNATLALTALNRPVRTPTRLLAVSNPVIAAQTGEIDEIEAALGPGHVQAIEDVSLPRPTLAARLDGADALHVLAHGVFHAEPLLSVVDLPSQQYPSTAAELLALPLHGLSLAVFSSCESGQVSETRSNEIFGLPWALLVGGVGTAVVSRWKALATSNGAWMGHFYRRLAAGASPAEAAAGAMRAMLADPATAHPFFWAGMQVIGR
jgi:CHAT domain-containing protein